MHGDSPVEICHAVEELGDWLVVLVLSKLLLALSDDGDGVGRYGLHNICGFNAGIEHSIDWSTTCVSIWW